MKPLIKTMAELRAVVSFSGDISFALLLPGLTAGQNVLKRYVGVSLMEQLTIDQDAPADSLTQLLSLAKVVVGNLALIQVLGTGNVTLSDNGVMRSKTAEQSDAFEWQIERAADAYLNVAYDGLETLLGFLADNLDEFPDYAESLAYKSLKRQLVPTAEIFSQYYEIGCSRLVYQTLLASMRTVEERTIRPLLGAKLADLLGETLSEEQEAQLSAARRALVYGTMARALRERIVSVTDQGVQVLSLGLIRRREAPSDKQLERSQAYFDNEFTQCSGELTTLLIESAPEQPERPAVSPIINKAIVRF